MSATKPVQPPKPKPNGNGKSQQVSRQVVVRRKITWAELERMVDRRAARKILELEAKFNRDTASLETAVRRLKTEADLNLNVNKGASDELDAYRNYPLLMMQTVGDVIHRMAVGFGGIDNADQHINKGFTLPAGWQRFAALMAFLGLVVFGVFSNAGLYKWASTPPGEYEFAGFGAAVILLGFLLVRNASSSRGGRRIS